MLGLNDSYDNENVVMILRGIINLDKHILLCLDNDINFLRFMKWPPSHVAFPKFMKKITKDLVTNHFY